jgi:hypothetical protein
MIPIGYLTLPEALDRVCDVAAERLPESNYGVGDNGLYFLLTKSRLPLFVARESESDPGAHIGEIYRVPDEDVCSLLEAEAGDLFVTGRASKWSTDYTSIEDWLQDNEAYASASPFDQEQIFRCLRRYSDARFVVGVDQLDEYIDHMWPSPVAVPKTGAPGRPSSMHLILAEFQRRLANQLTEPSREAEAKWLAAWLTTAHPTAHPCTAKTIKNRLPSTFRPKGNGIPK